MPLQQFDIALSKHPTLFLYGGNGAGKTWLAATLKGKIAFLNYDANLESLVTHPNYKNVTAFEGPKSWEEISGVFKDPILDQFDVLVLDNFTGLSRVLTEGALKIPLKNVKDGVRASPEIPIMRDYGLSSERLRYVVTFLTERKDKQLIVGIAHTKVHKDDVTEAITGGPALPGEVPAFVLSKFGELIYLKVNNEGKREAHFRPSTYYPAVTRRLKSDLPVVNPDLSRLYQS